MLFHSFEFTFFFLPFVFLCYVLLHRLRLLKQLRNPLILLASYIFYTWGDKRLIFFILFSSFLDYFIGRKLYRTEQPNLRKGLVALSITGNIGLLCILKYTGWGITELNALFSWMGFNGQIPPVKFILPPGISFYTFQTISYTVDIYRKQLRPRKKLVDYLTYVAFFPQLVAGPIERGHNLLPQIEKPNHFTSYKNVSHGIFLICWGLFKKVVFADNFGQIITVSLEHVIYVPFVPGAGMVAILAFCFQIYCDFSAYTDIARGCGKLFNIELSRNFLTPYFSTSPSDFWRRWHISLSSWLRDYLYIPLGGNRQGSFLTLRNLFITMFLGGLWHGAGFAFIVWGLYHGILLVLYHVVPLDKILMNKYKAHGKKIAMSIMFLFTLFGWLIFMSNIKFKPERALFMTDLDFFQIILQNIIQFFLKPYPIHSTFWHLFYGLVLFVVPIVITDYIGYRKGKEFVDLYHQFSLKTKVFLYLLIFYGISLLGRREAYDFIYFQF